MVANSSVSVGTASTIEGLERLEAAARSASAYLAAGKSPNTKRAYRSDFQHFEDWCAAHGVAALPAESETVALYLADIASGYKVSTLQRRVAAITHQHHAAGFATPTSHPGVKEVLKGIRRTNGTARDGKAALSVETLRAMVLPLTSPDVSLTDKRDHALLLLGFAGALRRSELVGLTFADITFVDEGAILRISRSKTDQTGQGREVGIAPGKRAETCPISALTEWLEASGIRRGPVFRAIDRHGHMRSRPLSGYSVDLIVKRRLRDAGVPLPKTYAAHSLRAGHATAAARGGAEERAIMRQGRWASERTVRGYVRHGTLFAENSSTTLGL